jgi:hypothetical protein
MTLDPEHIIPSFGVAPELSVTEMADVGIGFTVMVVEVTLEQLLAFVTVTV